MNDNERLDSAPDLSSLSREADAPRALEERIVRELRTQGLMGSHSAAGWPTFRWAAALAAAVLLFASGWFAGSLRRPALTPHGQQFLLLLRQGAIAEASPKQEANRVREYGAWARSLHSKGVLVFAEKLADETRLLSATQVTSPSLGVGAGTPPGPIRGFFLIRAGNLEEALRIAHECPHLRYGGVIEVRPVAKT